MNKTDQVTRHRFERLVKCEFLGTEDEEFRSFIKQMPDTHWSKYDLSAVRLGWEAYKQLVADVQYYGQDDLFRAEAQRQTERSE